MRLPLCCPCTLYPLLCPIQEDYRGYDWFAGTAPDTSANGSASCTLIAAHAERFIASHARAGEPFFLYLPFQYVMPGTRIGQGDSDIMSATLRLPLRRNIHAPYDCSAASFARFASLNVSDEQRTIFGYILELDYAVGRVVAALEAAGEWLGCGGRESRGGAGGRRRQWSMCGKPEERHHPGLLQPRFAQPPSSAPCPPNAPPLISLLFFPTLQASPTTLSSSLRQTMVRRPTRAWRAETTPSAASRPRRVLVAGDPRDGSGTCSQARGCLRSAPHHDPPALPAQVWEGGVRVPAFVHAPGRLSPRASAALVHVSDWTPTLVGLAGGAVEPGLDGLDVWQALQQGGPGPRDAVPANINPLCDGCVRLPGGRGGGGGPTARRGLCPRCLPSPFLLQRAVRRTQGRPARRRAKARLLVLRGGRRGQWHADGLCAGPPRPPAGVAAGKWRGALLVPVSRALISATSTATAAAPPAAVQPDS